MEFNLEDEEVLRQLIIYYDVYGETAHKSTQAFETLRNLYLDLLKNEDIVEDYNLRYTHNPYHFKMVIHQYESFTLHDRHMVNEYRAKAGKVLRLSSQNKVLVRVYADYRGNLRIGIWEASDHDLQWVTPEDVFAPRNDIYWPKDLLIVFSH
jgi:hypothetical protein